MPRAPRRPPLRPPDAPAESVSLDPAELAKFSALADEWWDERGSFAPLHKLNPARLAFLRDGILGHFGRDGQRARPLEGLRLLDIGCGGGLVCEPLARLGAQVTGLDPAERNLAVARLHAERSGLAIDYRVGTAEALAAAGERFDVVLALEVVEHVADPPGFVAACAALVEGDGLLGFSTLNRTPKAFALAILGAEYLLRWLPRGTHDWRRFVRPSELAGWLRPQGFEIVALAGLGYSLLTDRWQVTRDLDVNYLALARRSGRRIQPS